MLTLRFLLLENVSASTRYKDTFNGNAVASLFLVSSTDSVRAFAFSNYETLTPDWVQGSATCAKGKEWIWNHLLAR